jgi:hypothetical protein
MTITMTITITPMITITNAQILFIYNTSIKILFSRHQCPQCYQPDSSSLGTETIQAGAQLQSRHNTWNVMIHITSATVHIVAPVSENVYPVGHT